MLWRLRNDGLRGWQPAAVLLGVVAAVLAPWTVRNARQIGRATPTTTHGGYTLLLGNNPAFYQHLAEAPWGEVWDSRDLDQERAAWLAAHDNDEAAADRDSYRKAWRHIRSQPTAFAKATMIRIGRLWSPLPHRISPTESAARGTARWTVAAWYLALFAAGVRGLWLLSRPGPESHGAPSRLVSQSPWIDGLLLAATLTVVHAFFWSNLRMRAPLAPFLCLLAGAACEGRTRLCKALKNNDLREDTRR